MGESRTCFRAVPMGSNDRLLVMVRAGLNVATARSSEEIFRRRQTLIVLMNGRDTSPLSKPEWANRPAERKQLRTTGRRAQKRTGSEKGQRVEQIIRGVANISGRAKQ